MSKIIPLFRGQKEKEKRVEEREERGKVLGPSKDILDRIESRREFYDEMAHYARCQMVASAGDWLEFFAVLRENSEWHLKNGFSDDGIYLADRCAAIYAEEMREVEGLAKAARERAAARIESEFGTRADGIADALRENDAQGWARGLDWN